MNYSNYDFSSLLTMVGGITLIIFILFLAFLIVVVIANCKLYKKAGKPGWAAIVPIYSFYVLTEIAGLNWWWFLLAISDSIASLLELENLETIANLVSLFASFNIYYNIARKFNKSNGISILAGILSFIFVLIFGFSKNEVYDTNIPVSRNGVFGTPDGNFNNNVNGSVNNSNYTNDENSEYSYCGNCGTKLNKDARFCPNCGTEKK